MEENKYSIWLAQRPNCSARFRIHLLELFGSAKAVWEAQEIDFRAVTQMKRAQMNALMQKKLDIAEKIIEDCERHKIRILSMEDEDYPVPLRDLEDAPTVLYVKGTLPDWDAALPIGVVGTRKATKYGLGASYWFGQNFARYGAIVVSGMAKGIDAQASRGALSMGGQSIAVLGCGLDICYPTGHEQLMAEIIAHGAVVSEYPPGEEPRAQHFPERNRIISGLSKGVLIIEAPAKSGALITANLALEQGKELFAVPGNINSPASAGTNALIRDGAQLVTCAAEILTCFPDELNLANGLKPQSYEHLPEQEQEAPEEAPESEPVVPQEQEPQSERSKDKAEEPELQPELSKSAAEEPELTAQELPRQLCLNTQEQRILNAIRAGADNPEAVCAATGIAVQKVLASLTMLEINGRIVRRGATLRLAE